MSYIRDKDIIDIIYRRSGFPSWEKWKFLVNKHCSVPGKSLDELRKEFGIDTDVDKNVKVLSKRKHR